MNFIASDLKLNKTWHLQINNSGAFPQSRTKRFGDHFRNNIREEE